MPSGKTHDAITLLLAPPVFAAAFVVSGSVFVSTTAAAAFLFGGFMFGPDLDTISVQYSRWGPLRLLWFPYRAGFSHRSRWSHGLIFGTLFRVVYFLGVITLLSFLGMAAAASLAGSSMPDVQVFATAWEQLGWAARTYLGETAVVAVFAGMWVGAASHTFTDMAGTYIKTGRVTEFL